MSIYQHQKAGLGNVGSYQVSGIPFCKAGIAPTLGTSTSVVEFPNISKFIVVRNTGTNSLRVGFSLNGVVNSENYFLLGQSESFAGDLRVTAIHFMSDDALSTTSYTIIAGLTNINKDELLNNWSGSLGVG